MRDERWQRDSSDRPHLVAHRGYSKRYPENTLLALRAALNAGARFLEFDVQLTRDGVPVLLHDADLRRSSGSDDSLFDFDWRDLANASGGEARRFGDRFRTERIASLDKAAALLADWPGASAFVELKEESLTRFGADAVLDAALGALGPVLERCAIISFDASVVELARGRAPRRGWVLRSLDAEQEARARELAPDFLFCSRRRLPAVPADGAPALWPGPWSWAVYTVDETEAALAMGRLGFDFVETNSIGELVADPRLAPQPVAGSRDATGGSP